MLETSRNEKEVTKLEDMILPVADKVKREGWWNSGQGLNFRILDLY